MRARHLYVHVPFCARRCIYCDFSIAVRSSVPVREYLAALERELERHHESNFQLETLYFGGGTPSKLGSDGIERLVNIIARRASLFDGAELTLEANPEDVSREAVRAWRSAGINRLSLGVQSFDDRVLSWMHRTHDSRAAKIAVAVARDAGIENISLDLIFATAPGVPRDWREDLDAAIGLEVPHVSVYGLTIEQRTPLGRRIARKETAEAPEGQFEGEFLDAHSVLTLAGYQHYEVSNYALAGRHSRHNWAYWHREPYGGIGPSAHEFDGYQRRWNVSPYSEWLARLNDRSDPIGGSEALQEQQHLAEQVYLALRTCQGLELAPAELAHVEPWVRSGWMKVDRTSRGRLTATGWLRLDSLAADLTALRSH